MTTTRINHRDHNHANTAAARKACRDEIHTAHAALDAYYGDGTLGPDPRFPVVVGAELTRDELIAYVTTNGCMYHKDDGTCPVAPSPAYYRVEGDVWCQAGLDAFRAEGLRAKATRI